MVVETRSPGDESYEKLPFYAALGVPEVWIIERDTKEPEIHLLSAAATRKLAVRADGWLRSPGTGIELQVGRLGKLAVRLAGDESSRQELPPDLRAGRGRLDSLPSRSFSIRKRLRSRVVRNKGMFRRLNCRAGHYGLLILVWGALCLPNLGGPSLWDIDEGNNAEAAREMWRAGDWIVPTCNYQLRTDKPALLYWFQMAAFSVFGVGEFAARLPSALAALAAVLATYELGRRMFTPSRRAISRPPARRRRFVLRRRPLRQPGLATQRIVPIRAIVLLERLRRGSVWLVAVVGRRRRRRRACQGAGRSASAGRDRLPLSGVARPVATVVKLAPCVELSRFPVGCGALVCLGNSRDQGSVDGRLLEQAQRRSLHWRDGQP